MVRFSLLAACLGLAALYTDPVLADETIIVPQRQSMEVYKSDFGEAFWQLKTSPFICHLTNQVSGIGNLLLKSEAGGIKSISLGADPFYHTERRVMIGTKAPSWKDKTPVRLYQSTFVATGDRLNATVDVLRLLEAMQAGQTLVIDVKRQHDSTIRIQVPSVQINDKVVDFYRCHDALPELNYQQAKYTQLYYQPNQGAVNEQHKGWLDLLVEYLGVDTQVKGVMIEAHADASGNDLKNLMLSKKRALNIQRYLVEKNIAKDAIQIKYHGERYPAVSNKTRAGRDKNRRVEVKLWK